MTDANTYSTLINNGSNVRIVIHVLYSGLGGHFAVFLGLIQGSFLAEAEHRVLLVGVEPPLPDYCELLNELGIDWSYISKVDGSHSPLFYRNLYKSIFSCKPNIVFIHGLAAIPALLFRPKRPLILLRETESYQNKRLFDWALLAVGYAVADKIVHLTNEASSVSAKRLRLFFRPSKVCVIGNGLDTKYFSPCLDWPASILHSSCVRIGMVSRLQANKDHLTLIEAFSQLLLMRPDIDFRLDIAGDGATKMHIHDEIARLGLQKKVTMLGSLRRADVLLFLRSLDIYVHATHGETMSNSIMQAMSVGLPVIASAVPGVSNMISPSLGRLYPARDPGALASLIIAWIDNPEDAISCANNARNYATHILDAFAVSDQYESMVRSMLIWRAI